MFSLRYGLVDSHELSTALIDDSGISLTYDELNQATTPPDRLARSVVLLLVENAVASVIDLISLARANAIVALLPVDVDLVQLMEVVDRIRPVEIWGCSVLVEGYEPRDTTLDRQIALFPDELSHSISNPFGLLLITSGSTGVPRIVGLSWNSVMANASSIGQALGIESSDVALAHLPLNYSYGLSILTSNLYFGATVVLTKHSVLTKELWDAVDQLKVTSFAGVPSTYEFITRMKKVLRDHKSLRMATQAGGKLKSNLRDQILEQCSEAGPEFFIMYGQTEATARMTVATPDVLRKNPASVGWPVPSGRIEIQDPGPDGVGEIIYSGPNVMLSYIRTNQDFHDFIDLDGRLHTGDLGRLTDTGLEIVGRLARFAKIAGMRIQLDDVENALNLGETVVLSDDSCLYYVTTVEPSDTRAFIKQQAASLNIHSNLIRLRVVSQLPYLVSGKVDYATLEKELFGSEPQL